MAFVCARSRPIPTRGVTASARSLFSCGEPSIMEKFRAAMVLGAVGDALGYRKGRWEGCISGKKIQEELASLGGLGAQKLDPDNWPLSDATLMHMTTAEGLVTGMFRVVVSYVNED